MPKKDTLNRLLRLRELKEDQSRMALESAAAVRDQMQGQLQQTLCDQAQGRLDFIAGVMAADLPVRIAGLLELESATARQNVVRPRLDAAERVMREKREEFLMHRTERLQLDSVVDQAKQLQQAATARRAQQMLDDWYGRGEPGASKISSRRLGES